MKILMVLSGVLALTSAGLIGRTSGNGGGGYESSSMQTSSGSDSEVPVGGQIRKFITIFQGPEDSSATESKVIRVPGGGGKNINVIFVKTPSSSSQQKTEVILPEQPEQRNLVYVLTKKAEAGDNIRIRRPPPAQPSRPEVYFIRYGNKDANANNNQIGNLGSTSGAILNSISSTSISQSYGSPISF